MVPEPCRRFGELIRGRGHGGLVVRDNEALTLVNGGEPVEPSPTPQPGFQVLPERGLFGFPVGEQFSGDGV